MTRVDVRHGDGREVEIVRDLDLPVARRLVERDRNAGRWATIEPRPILRSGRIPR